MADKTGRKAAQHVLRALIQGEDPTGKALKPGSVVHRLDVMKALSVALEALTEDVGSGPPQAGGAGKEAERVGKKKPDRAGQGWNRAEDDELRHLFGQRRRVSDIALELGRTTGAITSRLVRLGLANERGDAQ